MLKSKSDLNTDRQKRVELKLPAIIHLISQQGTISIATEVLNLSAQGALIRIPPPLPKASLKNNDLVSLEIHFNTRELLFAKVVPSEEDPQTVKLNQAEQSIIRWIHKDQDEGIRFGIHFENLPEEKVRFLNELINYFSLLELAGVRFR